MEATRICSDALFGHVASQGFENVSCEKWFLNCKRKGIVFKGNRMTTTNSLKPDLAQAKEAERANMFPRKEEENGTSTDKGKTGTEEGADRVISKSIPKPARKGSIKKASSGGKE